ncbi:MAG: alpha-ketoglutarate-dependent dioxygenase AlkB [Pseudomonadota bacterium]
MVDSQSQTSLFAPEKQVLGLPDADIEYQPGYLVDDQAWALYDTLLAETDWQQERITLYGKTHDVPRLSCWMGDAGLDYGYSNMRMQVVPWNQELRALQQQLRCDTGHPFNSVLVNLYRDGQDSNGWHSDDEPELGTNPVIASVSLGAARDFHLRHKTRKDLRQSISLEHGSLLLMSGTTQHCWQHHVPKRAQAAQRINLTFRYVDNR